MQKRESSTGMGAWHNMKLMTIASGIKAAF